MSKVIVYSVSFFFQVGDYKIICYMQGCHFTPAFLVISFLTVEEAKKCALSLNHREISKQKYLRATLGLGHPRVYLWNAPTNQSIDEMKVLGVNTCFMPNGGILPLPQLPLILPLILLLFAELFLKESWKCTGY